LSLGESLTWIRGNAEEGDEYTITVKGDETIPPNTLSYGGKTIGITLKGDASEKTLELNGSGSLFTVERG
jgi:hypothetical protein